MRASENFKSCVNKNIFLLIYQPAEYLVGFVMKEDFPAFEVLIQRLWMD